MLILPLLNAELLELLDKPELPPIEYTVPQTAPPSSEYIPPTKGTFTSGFGQRWGRKHKGIDIAAPIGTPIFAVASGEVISSGWDNGGYGNLIKVKHDNDTVSLYAHNKALKVKKGDTVKQGQLLALMGSTGFSTGPHLHFELHKKGYPIDPYPLIYAKNTK